MFGVIHEHVQYDRHALPCHLQGLSQFVFDSAVIIQTDIFTTGRHCDTFHIQARQGGAGLSVIGHRLCLRNLRQFAIVEDGHHQPQLIAAGGHQFHAGHHERTVAHDAQYLFVRVGEFGADGRRNAVAHRIEIGG